MPMHYTQNTVTNAKIKENEWATANRLNFATFTSCIGLTGYQKDHNGNLFGIHLVQAQTDFFNDGDAQTVVDLVKANVEQGTLKIFGCNTAWGANPAYDTLQDLLVTAGYAVSEVSSPTDDGDYTVTFNTVTSQIDIVKS